MCSQFVNYVRSLGFRYSGEVEENCLLRTRECQDALWMQEEVARFKLKRKELRKTKRW